MTPTRLLAKSGASLHSALSIRDHTASVMNAAKRLVEATGTAQLLAIGLVPAEWLARFLRDVLLAAFLHDLGKANDHFQEMIRGDQSHPQGFRHEAVSFLIARQPEFQAWIQPALNDSRAMELILWAVAGHHRKFPPAGPPDECKPSMTIYLSHQDFQDALLLGVREFSLNEPPRYSTDRRLALLGSKHPLGEFEEAGDDADDFINSLSDEERRYVAVLKSCLICADVAGSIERRGAQSMSDWIPEAFARVPRAAELESIVNRSLKGGELRPFQRRVAEQTNRVVFVQAGCGSGKTSAAYLWAARQAAERRLFFCYPTTGTATEGYRDYLIDPALDADLIHGRSHIDLSQIDLEILSLGDDEPDHDETASNGKGQTATADSAGALEHWSTPLVSCTVDTVLGLLQNHRRGIFAWPSIAGAAVVFDEIHSYDEPLFAALVRFLTEVRGVRCLLMTASLPDSRLERLHNALHGIGERLGGPIDGPDDLQNLKRYQRDQSSNPWDRVAETLSQGGKVLWVVNTVADAMSLAEDPRAQSLRPILYHSRFRYVDRVVKHKEVIEAFAKAEGPAFAITTQVAEMSLDLSADLLITHLAPISSLIQRLGRLNRRARPDLYDGVRPFIVIERDGHLPYTDEQLHEARAWLSALGAGELSQADLARNWVSQPAASTDRIDHFSWIDGAFATVPKQLRGSTPGIEIILRSDRDDVLSKRRRPEAVRIPMPPPPKGHNWQAWEEVAFCKVPPNGLISYDPNKGAEWNI